jgi:hypothetical protein
MKSVYDMRISHANLPRPQSQHMNNKRSQLKSAVIRGNNNHLLNSGLPTVNPLSGTMSEFQMQSDVQTTFNNKLPGTGV